MSNLSAPQIERNPISEEDSFPKATRLKLYVRLNNKGKVKRKGLSRTPLIGATLFNDEERLRAGILKRFARKELRLIGLVQPREYRDAMDEVWELTRDYHEGFRYGGPTRILIYENRGKCQKP